MTSIRERLLAWHAQRRPGWQLVNLLLIIHGHTRLRDRKWRSAARMRNEIRRCRRLAAAHRVALPEPAAPVVSVVIPVYNNAALTQQCLAALSCHVPLERTEVIVVDDASTDGTPAFLAGIDNLRVVTNERNVGFTKAANRGAQAARGEFVAFLNNDTQVLPGWLDGLLATMDDPRVGVVGSKLVYPSGRLQEAGGLIWSDGTGCNIGRGGDPHASEFNFLRDVDYSSGASLMVRAGLLRDLGYFDEAFAPAYYEDTDLCFAARARGWRVMYQPQSVVVHAEGGTHGTEDRAGIGGATTKSNQERSRQIFVAKWGEALARHLPPQPVAGSGHLRGSARDALPRVLVCDILPPTPDRDSGGQRMDWILRLLSSMSSLVSLVPMERAAYPDYASALRQGGVDVYTDDYASLGSVLEGRADLYDLVLLSRPAVVDACIKPVRRHQPRATVVFDTVDLHWRRHEREAAVRGATSADPGRVRELELRCIRDTDLTATVSEEEALLVAELEPTARVVVLPNVHDAAGQNVPDWQGRNGLLFVGNFHHPPNADAVRWLVREILPRVRASIDVQVDVVGDFVPPALVDECGSQVRFRGWVPDLTPLFEAALVSVAPLRFGAGMKGKVGEALALGLPIVTTAIGAEGMELVDGTHALIRDDPESFAEAIVLLHRDPLLWRQLSAAGRELVRERWGPDTMRNRLAHLLSQCSPGSSELVGASVDQAVALP